MTGALAQIRKAVAAAAGSAAAGLLGIASAVNWHLAAITEGQISGVLFLALSTGVATFAIRNKVVGAELSALLGAHTAPIPVPAPASAPKEL